MVLSRKALNLHTGGKTDFPDIKNIKTFMSVGYQIQFGGQFVDRTPITKNSTT